MLKRYFISLFACFLALTVFFIACDNGEDVLPAPLDLNAMPYERLADYELFTGNIADQQPADGVLPYELNSELFSDYSTKYRFVYMPPGTMANYTEDGVLDMPIGTILIKTFSFWNDLRDESQGKDIIETRLLIRKADRWYAYSYLWNDAQTEATYSVVGRQENISWTHTDGSTRSTLYLIPNQNECKGCHNLNEKFTPIGPKVRNLNKVYDYVDGSMNQLEKWREQGFLEAGKASSDMPKVAVWDDPSSGTLDERARAYLDINCGHCHNPDAPANNSGLFLHHEETDLESIGVCKTPVAAGNGSGGLSVSIRPGFPDESIMIYRMNSTVPDVAMPELARSTIHDEGLELIRQWIESMDPGGC